MGTHRLTRYFQQAALQVRITLALSVVALGALAALLIILGPNDVADSGRGYVPSPNDPSREVISSDVTLLHREPFQDLTERATTLGERMVAGYVRDAITHRALAAAYVSDSSGAGGYADANGVFQLLASSAPELSVCAPGYKPQRVVLAGSESLEVSLEPACSTAALLLYSSRLPATDARVYLIDSEGLLGKAIAGPDAEGNVILPVGQPYYAKAVGGGRSSTAFLVEPYAHLTVVLGQGSLAAIRIRDGTGLPLNMRAQLELRRIDSPAPLLLSSQIVEGTAFTSVTPGLYQVESKDLKLKFLNSESPPRPNLPQLEYGAYVHVVDSPDQWLVADPAPLLVVRMQDAQQDGVAERATVWIETAAPATAEHPERWCTELFDLGVDQEGAELRISGLHLLNQDCRARLCVRTTLHASGYIDNPQSLLASGGVLTVTLASSRRVNLEIVSPDGRRYSRRVYARELSRGDTGPAIPPPPVVFEGAVNEDGRIDIQWGGGAIAIYDSGSFAADALALIDPDALGRGFARVTLPCGSLIVVERARSMPKVVATGASGQRYDGVIEGSELVFRDLPTGKYVVHPQSWGRVFFEPAKMSGRMLEVQLGGSDHVTVEWLDVWSGGDLEGRFSSGSVPCEVVLIAPFYDFDQRLNLMELKFWRVRPDGSFVLPESGGCKGVVVATRMSDGQLLPLNTCMPGNAASAEAGPVLLHYSGEEQRTIILRPRIGAQMSLVAPSITIKKGSDVTLSYVPIEGLRATVVSPGGRPMQVDVTPRIGAQTVVDLATGSVR